jgi:hypothetical protein
LQPARPAKANWDSPLPKRCRARRGPNREWLNQPQNMQGHVVDTGRP